MALIKKLIYGSEEFRLADDTDVNDLMAKVELALSGGTTRWVEFETSKRTERIIVTPGVPIRLQTYEPQPVRTARVL